MKKSLGIVLVTAIIAATPAWADRDRRDGGRGEDARPNIQKNRPAADDARRGDRGEREQRDARERESRTQGRLTREEREALHRDLDEIGRDIYPRGRGR